MKLYHLNPHDYAQEYFVCSDSKENAYNAVISYLEDQSAKEINAHFADFYREDAEFFKKFSWENLPEGYTLDEKEPNQVIQSEIC